LRTVDVKREVGDKGERAEDGSLDKDEGPLTKGTVIRQASPTRQIVERMLSKLPMIRPLEPVARNVVMDRWPRRTSEESKYHQIRIVLEFVGNKRGVDCLWYALWVARLFAGEACGTVPV
jgi:hypothetical protein